MSTIDPTILADTLRQQSGLLVAEVPGQAIADTGPASAQFFRNIVDVFTERLAATEDPTAAWIGLAENPGYGPDNDDIEDLLADVAIDAVGRIQFFEDIVQTFGEVRGWEWEADTTFEGPGGIVDEIVMVLHTIATAYAQTLGLAAADIVRATLAAAE